MTVNHQHQKFLLVFVLTCLALAATLAQTQTALPINFTEVPSKSSGITWVHENGRSPERQLPETCGGGGLFFDFDNDGWLDIYLVNSGPSDFYKPARPLKNALYRHNHDGTFT